MSTTEIPTVASSNETRKYFPPTIDTYGRFQFAYNFFNAELYEGALRDCLITLQRKRAATLGYFARDRFQNAAGRITDEIALNPKWFKHRSFADVMSTLVHEMVHLWQRHNGRPSRGAYHNKEWASEMKRIGLHPSHTGEPGGRETGQQMSHYIIAGGSFDQAQQRLAEMLRGISWFDADGLRPFHPRGGANLGGSGPTDPVGTRGKFRCPECGAQSWEKPSLRLICGFCFDEDQGLSSIRHMARVA